jgi:hypothetical protein
MKLKIKKIPGKLSEIIGTVCFNSGPGSSTAYKLIERQSIGKPENGTVLSWESEQTKWPKR